MKASSPSLDLQVLLVGAGRMAGEYLRALGHQGRTAPQVQVVGRSRAGAENFTAAHGVNCQWGGTAALADVPLSATTPAIVAVNHLELAPVTLALLERGCRHILVEKPGALYSSVLEQLAGTAEQHGARIYIAFNRRFYPAVAAARQAIAADGGLLSCSFDFTEIEESVLAEQAHSQLPDEVLQRWGIVNSLHVIDLFLHLAGRPERWSPQRRGELPWHRSGATFCGSGVTERGVMFSYLSTWNGAGRWGLELTTAARKLFLRPLESLQVQRTGSFRVDAAELPAEPEGVKPGFPGQLAAFLAAADAGAGDGAGAGSPDPALCPLQECIRHVQVAEHILGYESEVRR
ncbi:MAG: Gfo/Idh/MocA family oxidoreductase [Planctomycetota bacterium]